jgi:predicted RNA-binding Zn-ribbon protein involved in translation (DUF1610 family)
LERRSVNQYVKQDTATRCSYCHGALAPEAKHYACPECGSAHHGDCWNDNNGCAVPYCSGSGTARLPASPKALPAGALPPLDRAVPSPRAIDPGVAPAPPAEDPRRTGVVVPTWALVALLATVAAAGGYGVSELAGGGDEPNQSQSQRAAQPSPPRSGAAPAAVDPREAADSRARARRARERRVVLDVIEIVELSAAGRTAVQRGDYAGAAENRREVLRQIDALESGGPRVDEAVEHLRAAMQASLEYDEIYPTCPACAEEPNNRATAAKIEFVEAFNPLALRHAERSFAHGEL